MIEVEVRLHSQSMCSENWSTVSASKIISLASYSRWVKVPWTWSLDELRGVEVVGTGMGRSGGGCAVVRGASSSYDTATSTSIHRIPYYLKLERKMDFTQPWNPNWYFFVAPVLLERRVCSFICYKTCHHESLFSSFDDLCLVHSWKYI